MSRSFDTPFNGGAVYERTDSIDPAVLRKVRLVVCDQAVDAVEADWLLQALGLIPYSEHRP